MQARAAHHKGGHGGHPAATAAGQSRPSDHWRRRSAEFPPGHVESIIARADWGFLREEAQRLHPHGAACTIDLTRWTRGCYNAVFELSFADGTFWVARVRFRAHDGLAAEMRSEIATMNVVRARTSIPVPTVFGHSCEAANRFRYPYMLMSALPGRTPEGDYLGDCVPELHRPRVAAQLARYVWELRQVTFDQIGRVWCGNGLDEEPRIAPLPPGTMYDTQGLVGPFNSSEEYFSVLRTHEDARIRSRYGSGADWPQWAAVCEMYRNVIPMLIYPLPRRGPFPICFPDLRPYNILLDDGFNITGVLDWTGATTVPVEIFALKCDLQAYRIVPSSSVSTETLNFQKQVLRQYRWLEELTPPVSVGWSWKIFDSELPRAVKYWYKALGLNRLEIASRTGQVLLGVLFGYQTTLDNYQDRWDRGDGRQLLKATRWGR